MVLVEKLHNCIQSLLIVEMRKILKYFVSSYTYTLSRPGNRYSPFPIITINAINF
jgi:hypothetical protein